CRARLGCDASRRPASARPWSPSTPARAERGSYARTRPRHRRCRPCCRDSRRQNAERFSCLVVLVEAGVLEAVPVVDTLELELFDLVGGTRGCLAFGAELAIVAIAITVAAAFGTLGDLAHAVRQQRHLTCDPNRARH